jgi:plastocyanin domain-containing protein
MKLMILASLLSFTFGAVAVNAADKSTAENIKVKVTESGFEPSEIKVKSGSHIVLDVTRTTDATCATNIQFKEKKIKKDLPLNKEVRIDLGVVRKGDVRFACGMDMISGHVVAE